MWFRRIHITGPSGAGVTSLGRALGDVLASPHHDTDDYYWLPTIPPFSQKRPIPDRLRLMSEMFLDRGDWILSGSLGTWADPIIPRFDLVVLMHAPVEERLRRLRAREAKHFGNEAVAAGGWRHRETEAFIEWASHYEDGSAEGRSLAKHEQWVANLPCPVLRLDGSKPLPGLVDRVCRELAKKGRFDPP